MQKSPSLRTSHDLEAESTVAVLSLPNPWRWQWTEKGHGGFKKILYLKHQLACVFLTGHLPFTPW